MTKRRCPPTALSADIKFTSRDHTSTISCEKAKTQEPEPGHCCGLEASMSLSRLEQSADWSLMRLVAVLWSPVEQFTRRCGVSGVSGDLFDLG